MKLLDAILGTPNRRIIGLSLLVVALDQLTKEMVRRLIGYAGAKVIIPGFFKFVYWGNTGAAWSLFRGNNLLLAAVAVVALVVLFFNRHRFNGHTFMGQIAFGLIFGGIIGNLIDRLLFKHVIDFIYFYLERSDGTELGFPAFNVADSAICTGVGLVFLLTWKIERRAKTIAKEVKAEPLKRET